MSIVRSTLIVIALAGCTKVPGTESADDRRGPGVVAPAPAPLSAKVTLVSVTFADDCGGTAPAQAPASPSAPSVVAPSSESARPSDVTENPRYRCQQTSMQLSIAASKDAAVTIKSVEVFDEKGASLGTLATSKPTRWSNASSAYEAWDEKVAAGQTVQVSYVLAQPSFVNHYASHDRMFTVKVSASVGGIAQALQTTVMVVAQPAPMPT